MSHTVKLITSGHGAIAVPVCDSSIPQIISGAQGATGATGPIGPAGAVGAQGAAGQSGAIGATGAIGPAGTTGPSGAIGPSGATGAAGIIGPSGPAGAVGVTGPAGTTTGAASVHAHFSNVFGISGGQGTSPVLYDTEVVDTENEFSNGVFTPKWSGAYYVDGQITLGTCPADTIYNLSLRNTNNPSNSSSVLLNTVEPNDLANGDVTINADGLINVPATGESYGMYGGYASNSVPHTTVVNGYTDMASSHFSAFRVGGIVGPSGAAGWLAGWLAVRLFAC